MFLDKETNMNKRNFLKAGAGAGLVAVAPHTLAAMSNRLTREDFMVYIDKFNANDPTFIEFYHPDVVLELGAEQIRGNQGIGDFYANVKKYISEKLEVTQYIADENGIAVELPTRFECIADWQDSFWGVPLKKGQVMRIVSFVHYEVQDRKFSHIKSARYRMVHDWRMEATG
jgi:hypothetical protein